MPEGILYTEELKKQKLAHEKKQKRNFIFAFILVSIIALIVLLIIFVFNSSSSFNNDCNTCTKKSYFNNMNEKLNNIGGMVTNFITKLKK